MDCRKESTKATKLNSANSVEHSFQCCNKYNDSANLKEFTDAKDVKGMFVQNVGKKENEYWKKMAGVKSHIEFA